MKNTTTSEAPDFSVIGGGEKLNKYLLDFIFPVGSYFITHSFNFNTVAKVEAHFGGTWIAIPSGYFLEATTGNNASSTHPAGLPNIKGSFYRGKSAELSVMTTDIAPTGAFQRSETAVSGKGCSNSSGSYTGYTAVTFDASKVSSIYKDNITTVQPKSTLVYIYYREE